VRTLQSVVTSCARRAALFTWTKRAVLGLALLFVVSQFFRPARINPPINPALEINVNQFVPPAVQSIFLRSCNDCHSNRTIWPWYSSVAPASWLLAYDVNKGRSTMNLSDWGVYPEAKRNDLLHEMCKEVSAGEMPGMPYRLAHPAAHLMDTDVQTICRWTQDSVQGLAPSSK